MLSLGLTVQTDSGASRFIQFLPLVIRMVLSEIFEIVAARLSLRLIRLWRKIRAGKTTASNG